MQTEQAEAFVTEKLFQPGQFVLVFPTGETKEAANKQDLVLLANLYNAAMRLRRLKEVNRMKH